MSRDPVLVTVTEAAHLLALTKQRVYELAAAGDLTKHYLPGSERYFRLEYEQVRAYGLALPTEKPERE